MPTQRKNRQGKLVWQGRVTLPDGKRKEKTCRTKREALAWETLARTKLRELSANSTQKVYSLHSLMTLNLQSCKARGISDKTIHDKRAVAKALMAVIKPETPVTSIGYQQIENFLNSVAQGRSGQRANRYRGSILQAYRWGVKALGLPSACPWEVERYKEDQKPRYVPPLDDFAKVVDAAEGDKRRLLLTYFYTAARKQEILSLTWDDVDFSARTVRLWTGKRKAGRESNIVYMNTALYQVLSEQYQITRNQKYVFISQSTGTAYRRLARFLSRLCSSVGVKLFGFHAIRHLAASMMAKGGIPITDIQNMLRHQRADTTSRYLHSMQTPQAISQQLDNVLVLPLKRGESTGESSSALADDNAVSN
jgi:integrase